MLGVGLAGGLLLGCVLTYWTTVRPLRRQSSVLLFDGMCKFCDACVNFLIARDPAARIRYASLQSDYGRRVVEKFHITADSVVLVQDGVAYIRSDAILRAVATLEGPVFLLACFLFVPRVIRDTVYTLVGSVRHRVFGTFDECRRPTPELKSRFLD